MGPVAVWRMLQFAVGSGYYLVATNLSRRTRLPRQPTVGERSSDQEANNTRGDDMVFVEKN